MVRAYEQLFSDELFARFLVCNRRKIDVRFPEEHELARRAFGEALARIEKHLGSRRCPGVNESFAGNACQWTLRAKGAFACWLRKREVIPGEPSSLIPSLTSYVRTLHRKSSPRNLLRAVRS